MNILTRNPSSRHGRSGRALVTTRAALLLCAGLAACGGSDEGTPQEAATDTVQMRVNNQVQLLPACGDSNSLTFFEGYGKKDLPANQVTPVTVSNLWGTYKIGFQVNGWYWRCAGAAECPNPSGCQNPDNAGQVGIIVVPAGSGAGCGSATLDTTWTLGLCDANVPSARNVVTVSLEDPATCQVRVEASGLDTLAPSDGCCDCSTCTTPPGSQQTHCR